METQNTPAQENEQQQTKVEAELQELAIKEKDHEKIRNAYARHSNNKEMRKQLSAALAELLFEVIGAQGEFFESEKQLQTILGKIGGKYIRNTSNIKRMYYDPKEDKIMVSFNTPDSSTEIKTQAEIESSPADLETNQGDESMSEQNKVNNDAAAERDPAVTDPTLPPSVGQGEDQTAQDSGGEAETPETSEENGSSDENTGNE